MNRSPIAVLLLQTRWSLESDRSDPIGRVAEARGAVRPRAELVPAKAMSVEPVALEPVTLDAARVELVPVERPPSGLVEDEREAVSVARLRARREAADWRAMRASELLDRRIRRDVELTGIAFTDNVLAAPAFADLRRAERLRDGGDVVATRRRAVVLPLAADSFCVVVDRASARCPVAEVSGTGLPLGTGAAVAASV
ncbi:MAG TPA: hypothetical protein VHM24_04695, partial [Gemmatimonadaceae bacterium]|nr:hypothetical protein [Gemmatimonadaceae bacterium]